ncbi:type I pullulanase [Ruminococcus bovis]|uniref:Type I pullulanase n=1 Tax=Ruminococcus bovis TaxID=2564099 RepID=A0A4P8XTI1_9FIRM|nr:type I pullulanase [Ruminococcus bovis]QCT05892.1 type I pullulanase [Ruminococcus bovis]
MKRIISVVLSIMMLATVIPFATVSSSAATANTPTKYETAAHEIDSKYSYNGTDLGANYTKEATTFKVWAPTATSVKVNFYATGSDKEKGAKDLGSKDLTLDEKTGVYSVKIDGDLVNTYYTYTVTAASIADSSKVTTKEIPDVYSVATGVNGKRSMVCDLSSTNPEGWDQDKHVLTDDIADASIWEIHVKDFSYSESSGVSAKNRGKYLAFTELGTTLNNLGSIPTCVDYLKELGISYVQINPMYDFGSVDEAGSDDQFNWGYDPMNYNVPEGSYSSNPYDGNVRINEMKQMIQALHKAGIGVIMDVVYNHMYNTDTSFQGTVPDYYYRKNADGTWSNGSGCGNDTASERAMYHNFMVQSVNYWATEYHIDGFRFDLMGLHDVKTMNAIRSTLDKISTKMPVYGEGWAMTTKNDLTDYDGETVQMASQGSTKNLDSRVGMFNDQFRDGVKGSYSSIGAKGYIQGNLVGSAKDVRYGVRANTAGASANWKAYSPAQCVNYVSCHDNNTLYDKLWGSVYGKTSDYRARNNNLIRINKFAETIGATSQGLHFFLAGEEMGRSKDGDENSYNSPATENMFDWNDVSKNADLVSYYKGMLDIRKAFSPFTTDDINLKNNYKFGETLTSSSNIVSYTVSNSTPGEWNKLAVVMNNDTKNSATVSLGFDNTLSSNTEWVVIADSDEAGLTPIKYIKGNEIEVPSQTAMVLVEKSTYEKANIKSNKSKVTVVNKDADTGKVLSKQVLYGTVGTKYEAKIDDSLKLQYDLLNVEGEQNGTFGSTDKTVTFNFVEYVPESLQKTLTGKEKFTVKDATLIQKYLSKTATFTDEQIKTADYNQDGVVNVADATLIQKKITHKDYGLVNTIRVRYISKATNKPVADDQVFNIVAGKTDTYSPEKLVGYKYANEYTLDGTKTTSEDSSVTIQHKFNSQLLLFYYDDDNYDVTLHVKHSGSATWTPTLWAWYNVGTKAYNIYDGWPGQNMTKGDNGWYTASFKVANGTDYSVIINNNGATQTQDYDGVSGSEKWIIINDDKVSDKGDFLSFYDTNPEL